MKRYLYIVIVFILLVPVRSQVFFPPYINNADPPPPDTTELTLNDPVGKPYGGGAGYFPIYELNDCDIVINSNDFSNLKNLKTAFEDLNTDSISPEKDEPTPVDEAPPPEDSKKTS